MSAFLLGFGTAFLSVAFADSLAPRPHGAVVVIFGLLAIIASLIAELVSQKSTPNTSSRSE